MFQDLPKRERETKRANAAGKMVLTDLPDTGSPQNFHL